MLSGGEQQRIGIKRAVVNESSLLIADEPTGNLDPELSAEIIKIFKDFNAFGVTALIATHDSLARKNASSLTDIEKAISSVKQAQMMLCDLTHKL